MWFEHWGAAPMEVREGVRSPGAIGGCEPPDMGDKNKTQVL